MTAHPHIKSDSTQKRHTGKSKSHNDGQKKTMRTGFLRRRRAKSSSETVKGGKERTVKGGGGGNERTPPSNDSAEGEGERSTSRSVDKAKDRVSHLEEEVEKEIKASRRYSTYELFIIGSSVIGLGNVVDFPKHVAMNGGGRFVIVYLLCMVVFGVPMVYMELLLATYANLPLSTISGAMVPIAKGVSIAQTYMLVISVINYIVSLSWVTFYMITGVVHGDMAKGGTGFETCAALGPLMSRDCFVFKRSGMCCMAMSKFNNMTFDCCINEAMYEMEEGHLDALLCHQFHNTNYTWPFRLPSQIFFEESMFKLDNHHYELMGGIRFWLLLICFLLVVVAAYMAVNKMYANETFVHITLVLPILVSTIVLVQAVADNAHAAYGGLSTMFDFSVETIAEKDYSWIDILSQALEHMMHSLSLSSNIVGFFVRSTPSYQRRELGANIWAATWMIVGADVLTSLVSCVGIFALMGAMAVKETCNKDKSSAGSAIIELQRWIDGSGHASQMYMYGIVPQAFVSSGSGWRMYYFIYHITLLTIGLKVTSIMIDCMIDCFAAPLTLSSRLWRRRFNYVYFWRMVIVAIIACWFTFY